MTRWDAMLELLAHEYHVATDPPQVVQDGLRRGFPAIPDSLPGKSSAARAPESVSHPSPRSLWVQEHIAFALDRTIDEMFTAYDRISRTSAARR
jgi:hypothetical protein